MEEKRVITAVPLPECRLLLLFADGTVKLWACEARVCSGPAVVEPDGGGIVWENGFRVDGEVLYREGVLLPLTRADFLAFCQYCIVSTAEAAQMLGCTRQNIDSLVRRGKLMPVKAYAKNKLFLRSDILRRIPNGNVN